MLKQIWDFIQAHLELFSLGVLILLSITIVVKKNIFNKSQKIQSGNNSRNIQAGRDINYIDKR